MSELTREEFEAFEGLDQLYRDMEDSMTPPMCHFTFMEMEYGDDGDRSVEWWECKHCGHTKEF